jgi:8-amino-7-oxononanoate synthase
MDKEIVARSLKPISSKCGVNIRIGDREYIDFSSNDYLGLSQHSEMIKAAVDAAERYGTGSGGSRLLGGDSDLFHELEDAVASFKGKESALVFNSGYQANLGIISTLCRDGRAILMDKLCHASIVDGVMLSGTRFFRFRHNDAGHLEELLKKHKAENPLIITESVFSMDGDIAPLKDLVSVKDKYGAALMVDEAHATGIFGKNGAGVIEEAGLAGQVDLIMGTFSKALGSFGAYLACSTEIKQYLVNTARSFIYSTALPPAVIACNIKSIELVKKEPQRRKQLLDLSNRFIEQVKKSGLDTPGVSQIVPVITGEDNDAVSLSEKLRAAGFWALPIRYPTVPKGQARVRFSINFGHTKEMTKKVVECLGKGQ